MASLSARIRWVFTGLRSPELRGGLGDYVGEVRSLFDEIWSD